MKQIFIFCSLMLSGILSACGGNAPRTTPALPDDLVQVDMIKGHVSELQTGAYSALLVKDGREIDGVNQGTVREGVLQLALKGGPALGSYSLLHICPFTGDADADPFVLFFDVVNVTTGAIDPVAAVREYILDGETPSAVQVARVYSDQAATVSGTLECTTGPIRLNVSLKKGWNALEWLNATPVKTLGNLRPSARSALRAELSTRAVQVSSADIVFTDNDSATSQLSLSQAGQYTGTVTLSSDLPGLTVEPDTFNLTEKTFNSTASDQLNTLGMHTQRVSTPVTFHYSGRENRGGTVHFTARDQQGNIVGGGDVHVLVQRPGVRMWQPYTAALVTSGGADTVGFSSQSVAAYEGPVTYTLLNLPAGMSAEPFTQQIPSVGEQYIKVPVTLAPGVTPGLYPVTVHAKAGTTGSSVEFDLRIESPKLTLLDPSEATIFENGLGSLVVKLTTNRQFAGPTTLNLSDLPAGVTTIAQTVTVQPGAVSSVTFPLTATPDTTVGTYRIRVSGADISPTTSVDRWLHLRPVGTAVNGQVDMAANAELGIWTAGERLDTQVGSSTQFQLIDETGTVIKDVTLPARYQQILSDGNDLIALNYGSGNSYRISREGTPTALPPITLPESFYIQTASNHLDDQGRIWFCLANTFNDGLLLAWNPANGLTSSEPIPVQPWTARILLMTMDGRSLLTLPTFGADHPVQQLSTTTGQWTDLNGVNRIGDSAAEAVDGTLWFSRPGQLVARDATGKVTVHDFAATTWTLTLYGFDRKFPNILWASDGSAVFRIDVTTLTFQTMSVSTAVFGSPSAQRGLKLISYSGFRGSKQYISLLK